MTLTEAKHILNNNGYICTKSFGLNEGLLTESEIIDKAKKVIQMIKDKVKSGNKAEAKEDAKQLQSEIKSNKNINSVAKKMLLGSLAAIMLAGAVTNANAASCSTKIVHDNGHTYMQQYGDCDNQDIQDLRNSMDGFKYNVGGSDHNTSDADNDDGGQKAKQDYDKVNNYVQHFAKVLAGGPDGDDYDTVRHDTQDHGKGYQVTFDDGLVMDWHVDHIEFSKDGKTLDTYDDDLAARLIKFAKAENAKK